MTTVSLSAIAYRSIGIFIALSIIVDLLLFNALDKEIHRYFLTLTVAKYLVPLTGWFVIAMVQRRIKASLE